MRQCCGKASSPAKLSLERSARALAEAGMHVEAAQALAERAQLSPKNPMIWNDLGVQHMAAGQPEAAHSAFLRAQKELPDYALPLYNLGLLALGRCVAERARQPSSSELTGKFAREAIGYLKESLSQDPPLYQAHALLSNAYEAAGEGTLASFHAHEASRLNPDEEEKPKKTWFERVLRRAVTGSARTSLPFLVSSGEQMHVGVH